MLPATLAEVERRGLLLDRGYDNRVVHRQVAELGIDLDVPSAIPTERPRAPKQPSRPRRRWPVERTNSWLSNYGQLRRNTDRCKARRRAQLTFVIAILLIVKLIDRRARDAG